jgi:hypothetical protein
MYEKTEMKTGRQLGLHVLLVTEHREEVLGEVIHIEDAVCREALKCWVWNIFFWVFCLNL